MTKDVNPADLQMFPSPHASRAHLEAFYDVVLLSSFRTDELVPRGDFVEAHRRAGDRALVIVAATTAGEVIGGVSATFYSECGVLLIGYLAVVADYRGQGVGNRMVEEAAATWLPRLRPKLIVGEVEDPAIWRGDEYGNGEDRLRLYRGLGARVLDLPYFQPRLSPDKERVRGLLLMAFPTELGTNVEEIDRDAITCFLKRYIREYEGAVHDAEARALLSAASDSGQIRFRD